MRPLWNEMFVVPEWFATNNAISSLFARLMIQFVTSFAKLFELVFERHSVSGMVVPFLANRTPRSWLFPADASMLANTLTTLVSPEVFLIAKVFVVPKTTPLAVDESRVAVSPVDW